MKTENELQSFEEEFFIKIREKEAWKNISQNEDLPWDMKFIESHVDKLDWEELCANSRIQWNIELIEKFRRHIDWDILSDNIISNNSRYYNNSIDWSLLKKYERFWNWSELSQNSGYIPNDILEEYADNWDWKVLINNRQINWTYNLFDKFKQYIPLSDFENLKCSALWSDLIEIDEKIITGKILAR